MSLNPEQQDALQKIATAAVACEQETGCPAELTAAQCIFESGYLSRCPGNNCFGIKSDRCGSGDQYVLTHEYLSGEWVKVPQSFETYVTLADCFADHARLIQQGCYAAAWASYKANHNLDAFISGVAAHYATDPDYFATIKAEAHSPAVQMALQQVRAEI